MDKDQPYQIGYDQRVAPPLVDKPHLRLHVNPGNRYPSWSVEYVHGPCPRTRKETFNHQTSAGALRAANGLWF